MSLCQVKHQEDGTFAVVCNGSVVEDGITTHSRAWKLADRHNEESPSPAQDRTDYHFKKSIQEENHS